MDIIQFFKTIIYNVLSLFSEFKWLFYNLIEFIIIIIAFIGAIVILFLGAALITKGIEYILNL